MAEDKGKEEEKFDFTPEGEGYLSLDEARILALQAANETPGDYGSQYQGTTMVFGVVEDTETEDNYIILLSVRPQGEFSGTPGQEQFFIGKEGSIALRQVLSIPRKGGGFPILPVAIGLVVVGIIAAVGAVLALGSSGGDSVPIAAVAPTETPAPTDTPAPTETLAPTEAPAPTETPAPTPTFTPMPTYTPYPTPTPRPTYTPRPIPTARVIVVTPTPTPRPTPTRTPRPTSRPVATALPMFSADCYTAPDGAVVTAWINGEQVATTTVAGGSYTILIDQEDYEFTGEPVWFKVNGIEALQDAKWVQGGADELNLTTLKNFFLLRSPPSQLQITNETVPPHVFVGTASIC